MSSSAMTICKWCGFRLAEAHNRLPPKHLFDYGVDIWYQAEVFKGWKAARAECCVCLLPCAFLDIGMQEHR